MSLLWYTQNESANASDTVTSGSLRLDQLLSSITEAQIMAFVITGIFLLLCLTPEKPTVAGAPVHGRRWRWEPTLWLQSRFTFGAREIVASGYAKYKNRPFVVKRYDVDLTVLPHKYLEELRLVPESKLSAARAQAQNAGHKWTGAVVFSESHLHLRALQNKLTAELSKYLDVAYTELDYAWALHMPKLNEWQEFDIQEAMRMIVSRMFASAFVGHPTCQNEAWVKMSVGFSIDLLTTAFTIRIFPTWLHPIIARLVPARYRIAKTVRLAHKILEPLVEKHADVIKKRATGENVSEEDTIFNWMIDNGTDDENTIDQIVMRQLLLTVVSIHTTTATIMNVLFDLTNGFSPGE
ncbi:hypothetical protein ONZ43_g5371 [Nemania bipapillata]|uniref:Uncharacterized protein n=1 Tax=Nemania bipapillata TaxID=110536 RepID=A0ACC2IBQ2_9PEZI|nr:hypothetical protein ONZ43_g5371 [Nemania bipapillata]